MFNDTKSHAHRQGFTKTHAKFHKKIRVKLEGVHSQDTRCLYVLVEVESSNCVKSDKNSSVNLRITAKPHKHLQTSKNPPAQFQKDPGKIVGGVAFTR